MARSVPGLDKCDGGGKWLLLDTSHQLLRQCCGQDKQNGTRAPRHREERVNCGIPDTGRSWRDRKKRSSDGPRSSPCSPGVKLNSQALGENSRRRRMWESAFERLGMWVLWVFSLSIVSIVRLWRQVAGFKGRLPLSLAAAAAPQVWSGCTLQGHTSPSSTLPSCIRFARPVMAIFNGWRSQVIAFCVYVLYMYMYLVHSTH